MNKRMSEWKEVMRQGMKGWTKNGVRSGERIEIMEGIQRDVQGSNGMVDRLGPNQVCEWRREMRLKWGRFGSVEQGKMITSKLNLL
jgi:hypothetical protein